MTLIIIHSLFVTFKWNVRLDLSGMAATKTFGSLLMQLPLEILGESTRASSVRMIRGDRGRGRYPRCTRWVQGGSVGSAQLRLD